MHTPETIARMLGGSRRERAALASEIIAHIDRAVHYALRAGRYPAELREDRVSELLLYLYRDDAKVLRRWDPTRAGFRGYLNMIAGRHVHRRRAGRPAPASLIEDEPPVLPEDVGVEEELTYRAALEELYDWVKTNGSKKDQARFEALLVEGRSPAEVATHEGGSPDAIYTWLSRFKRRIKEGLPHVIEMLEKRS